MGTDAGFQDVPGLEKLTHGRCQISMGMAALCWHGMENCSGSHSKSLGLPKKKMQLGGCDKNIPVTYCWHLHPTESLAIIILSSENAGGSFPVAIELFVGLPFFLVPPQHQMGSLWLQWF